jgi:hypothetical protein
LWTSLWVLESTSTKEAAGDPGVCLLWLVDRTSGESGYRAASRSHALPILGYQSAGGYGTNLTRAIDRQHMPASASRHRRVLMVRDLAQLGSIFVALTWTIAERTSQRSNPATSKSGSAANVQAGTLLEVCRHLVERSWTQRDTRSVSGVRWPNVVPPASWRHRADASWSAMNTPHAP